MRDRWGERLRVRRFLRVTAVSCAGAALGLGALPVLTSQASASPSPITVGIMADVTGPAGASFGDVTGWAQARIDLQNAHGGVDGHKINAVVRDTATSPTQSTTAA